MNHVRVVANGFRAVGLVLAIPSAVLVAMFGSSLLALHSQPAPAPSHTLDIGKYGLVGLLQNGAIGLSNVLGFLGAIGLWAAVLIAILAIVTGLLGLLFFFTGRGIAARRQWARVAAIVLCILVVFVAWSMLFAVPRSVAVGDLAFIGASLYALWVLGWRYVRQGY